MDSFIKEKMTVSEKEITEKIKAYNMCAYALYTDKITCGDEINDAGHLLEVRLFNETSEVKFFRSNIGQDFLCRIIDDKFFKENLKSEPDEFERIFENRVLDDIQFLDIDSTVSRGRNYITTGGGCYTLPFEHAQRIMIRNYINYSSEGIAEIKDFRIVKILREGDEL